MNHVENPRVELEEHYYNAANTKLMDLGLEPHLLGDELVRSMLKVIERYRERVVTRAIAPATRWKPDELEETPTVVPGHVQTREPIAN